MSAWDEGSSDFPFSPLLGINKQDIFKGPSPFLLDQRNAKKTLQQHNNRPHNLTKYSSDGSTSQIANFDVYALHYIIHGRTNSKLGLEK